MEATSVPAPGPSAPPVDKLHRTALGVPDIVFFIVAASAPLTVVAGGVASTYLITGNAGVPLLFLVLGAILAVFVSGYAAMSHHITNAGAFYAYVSQGIGKVAGVGTAFVALIAYNAMQIGILGLFGAAFSAFMLDKADINFAWYSWVFIAIALIGILGWLRVDLNAKVLAIFLTLEIIVVAVFDLVVATDPAPAGIVADGFDPSIAFGAGLGAALSFTMAAFVGFESAAIYGEECKDPRRTVARATYIALGITSIFYALSAWMLASAVGAEVITDPKALVEGGFVGADPKAPDPTTVLFITLDVQLSTTIADIATLLFCTSLFAASLSFHNAVGRYFFALGRAGVLPSAFGRTRSNGAPYVGSLTQSLIALTVVAIFALSDNDPVLQLFTWLTNLGALGVILLLALASFAVVGYFARREHTETAWTSMIAPAIAGVALTVVFFTVLGNFNQLITGLPDAPGDSRSVILPAILIGGGVLGMIVGAIIRTSRPEVYARIGEMGEEEPPKLPRAEVAVSRFADSITVEELERDPYPIYERLRRKEPVAWVPAVEMWLATRWDEAVRVASEPELFGADMPGSPIERSFGSPTILTCDGEVHADLRAGVDPKLRPREVEGYIDELIEPIARERLDALGGGPTVDLMSGYFEPVSVLGLGVLLGLEDIGAETLRGWFAGLAEGAVNFAGDPERQAASDATCAEIDAVVGPRLERLVAEPHSDRGSLVSHMLHGGLPAGESRAPELVMPSLKVILLGGMQEPGHGAGTVMYALLRHPEAMEAVRAGGEEVLAAAIEEGMRWISPIGTQGRRTRTAVELGDVELPADAPVAAVIASANRDEARFDHPDEFDLDRGRSRLATFGFGRHFCSGHAFARQLERIALRELLDRAPRIGLSPAHEVPFSGWEFRAPRELHVHLN